MTSTDHLRNIAIIAHVDHGKTTLIDKMLRQSGTLGHKNEDVERIMDTDDLEKERGITILSKNTAIDWQGYRINVVDTPGHADFGGEVERIMSMVDSVLLLVDAVDGPMPQTRFVTQKAFAQGLNPILVINKVDRPGARPEWVMNQVFDLFDQLGGTDKQLDFPIVYASALEGFATLDIDEKGGDMQPLFETIVKEVPSPDVDPDGPLQMQISSLDYSSYVGAIGIGRITRGQITPNKRVTVVDREGETRSGKILQVLGHLGLQRYEAQQASAGDIVAITGLDTMNISDTICDPSQVEARPALTVDEPTISMNFLVNTSPFAGKEGKYLTSRQIKERLDKELIHDVALRVEQTEDRDKFRVSGRGELHLAVLIENMRREGYELAVSRPEVVINYIDGKPHEPYEFLMVDVEEQHQGAVIEQLGMRRAEMNNMIPDGKGRVRVEFDIPSRGLIGFHTEFQTLTSGTGLMHHIFDRYAPVKPGEVSDHNNGVLISNCLGKTTAFALWNLQERGQVFVHPQTEVYEGMIIGSHNRDNDLVVNPTKAKQLTNVRAAGSDENIVLTPPIIMSLEQALEFIQDDELVEVTPDNIRLRKKHLKENERKRANSAKKN